MSNVITWSQDAEAHVLFLLDRAGAEYAVRHAEWAEKLGRGVLAGLKDKLDAEIARRKREAALAAKEGVNAAH